MRRDSLGYFRKRTVFFIFLFCFSLHSFAQAAPPPFDPGIPPIKESKAYKLFLLRPYSELSKIIYLIDRFKEAKVKVVYDGLQFEPGFAVRIAKWFLSQHYRKEKATEWIMVYCNQSLLEHQLIWVTDEKKGCKLSRDVLLEELKALEATYSADPNFKGNKKKA